MNLKDMEESDVEKYMAWEHNRLRSISSIIVENFPGQMMWHTIIVSMVCVRSPTDFATSITLFAMLLRILMVFGYYSNKRIIYIGAGAFETFINFILLFICMGYNPPELSVNTVEDEARL